MTEINIYFENENTTLYNNDCLDVIHHMNNNDQKVDLVVTSPPYFNAKEYSSYKDTEEYMDTMKGIFKGIYDILNESRMVIINISPVIVPRRKRSEQSIRVPLPFYFVPMMESLGFEFLEDIIWKKPEGAASNRNGGFYRHRKPLAYKPNIVTEYILVFKKKSNKLIDKFIRNDSLVKDGYERTNVWEMNPKTNSKHPAPFPLELPEKCILYYSYEGDVIFDPFMGSGTTGIAASRNKRKFIGVDYIKEYCYMAKDLFIKEENQDG